MSSYSIAPTGLTAGDLLANRSLGSTRPKSAAELAHAAGEFESILLTQWLQPAETSFGSVPGSDDDSDSGDEQIKSFGVQALAKSFTDAGGIGLAKIVSKALQESQASPVANNANSSPAASPIRALAR